MTTPFHAAIAADLADIMADPLGMAEDVRLLPPETPGTSSPDEAPGPEAPGHGAPGCDVRAIFQAPGAESSPAGISAPVVTVAPVLHIPLLAVETALGRPLSTRDRILARGRLWRVHNPQDSGRGLLRVTLLAVGGPPSPGTLAQGNGGSL